MNKFIHKLHADDTTLRFLKDENLRISLSRTKSRIRELALCNNFEYFGTITINGYICNRYELDECQKRLKNELRNIRLKNNRLKNNILKNNKDNYNNKKINDKLNNNNNFKYLIITEKHKDGAFHFHRFV